MLEKRLPRVNKFVEHYIPTDHGKKGNNIQ